MAFASEESVPRVAIQVVQGCLVVPVQVDLYEASLVLLRRDLLEAARVHGVLDAVIDLSGVFILDRFSFDHLVETTVAADLMGVRTVFAGVRAAVASCLVELDAPVEGLAIERSVEAALERFRRERETAAPVGGDDEAADRDGEADETATVRGAGDER